MILLQEIIHQIYFVLPRSSPCCCSTRLFRRKTRPGLAYDIVYAYAHHPVHPAGAAHQVR